MKKIVLFIMIFSFCNTVYAKELNTIENSVNYSLSERIEDEENKEKESSGALQYFILIVAFLGISGLFLFLKGSDD